MGSRIMHVIIASGIAEKLSIHDKTSFLLGAVAPDAVHSKRKRNLTFLCRYNEELYKKNRL